MNQDSGNLSVILGISLLAIVILGMGGIAYSFYRTEFAQQEQESADMANDDSPFEQLEREQNRNIVPVPQAEGGSGAINSDSLGIPTGTYSNPPTNLNSFNSAYSVESNPSLNHLESSVEQNQNRIDSNLPDYSSPATSNNFNQTTNNSLVKPLEDSDFLETPTTSAPQQTPTLTDPLF